MTIVKFPLACAQALRFLGKTALAEKLGRAIKGRGWGGRKGRSPLLPSPPPPVSFDSLQFPAHAAVTPSGEHVGRENFPFSLSRNIISHSMKNVAFRSSDGRLILPILTDPPLIHFSTKGFGSWLFELGSERVKLVTRLDHATAGSLWYWGSPNTKSIEYEQNASLQSV